MSIPIFVLSRSVEHFCDVLKLWKNLENIFVKICLWTSGPRKYSCSPMKNYFELKWKQKDQELDNVYWAVFSSSRYSHSMGDCSLLNTKQKNLVLQLRKGSKTHVFVQKERCLCVIWWTGGPETSVTCFEAVLQSQRSCIPTLRFDESSAHVNRF